MPVLELAQLFPPVTRFFVGFLLIVGVVAVEVLFAYFIYTLYRKEE